MKIIIVTEMEIPSFTLSKTSYFIREHFSECWHFDKTKYLEKLLDETGKRSWADHECRMLSAKANEQFMQDIVDVLGESPEGSHADIVIECNCQQAKSRITIIEALRAASNAPIVIYVLMPSEKQLYGDKREIWKGIEGGMEFPNIAEGYSHIYKVMDNDITEVARSTDENIGMEE